MSIRSDAALCRYCGSVDLVARLVRLGDNGEYEYACASCAAAERVSGGGVGPE